jgi:NAD(P)-dependent dehydrogenase (short-subunit alcohol dehydrogenase family)
MDLKLKNKTAFISGSTQGIGFAIALQLLQEGVKVIINGRTIEKVNSAVNKLKDLVPNGDVSGIATDFSIPEEVDLLEKQLPELDILINNVGIFEQQSFIDITNDDWRRFFEINVMSGVRLSRVALPKMIANNQGRILFISSESAVNVPENMIHYGMTKTAMLSIANGLSKLTKGTEVTVNTVLGGPTYSDGVAETIEQIAAAQQMTTHQLKSAIIEATNPHSLIQRFIEPTEIANLVTYLCSPLAIATNGSSLRADGGVLRTI